MVEDKRAGREKEKGVRTRLGEQEDEGKGEAGKDRGKRGERIEETRLVSGEQRVLCEVIPARGGCQSGREEYRRKETARRIKKREKK